VPQAELPRISARGATTITHAAPFSGVNE
jgi:hypothetical protein